MSITEALIKKYALSHAPADSEISRWVAETEHLLSLGIYTETAGARAAEEIFPDAGAGKYDPDAEDVFELLDEAKAETAKGRA